MELIHHALPTTIMPPAQAIAISVDRLTLAKRRWRGMAADGREFGFDLEHPVSDGENIFCDGATVYRVEQQPEMVLAVDLGTTADAARLGWLLGNLHFQIALSDGMVQAPDDPAIRQLLQREGINFCTIEALFRPLGGKQSREHGHGH